MASLPDNVKLLTTTGIDGSEVDHVIIDNGDGSSTVMFKSVWDAQQELAQTATPYEGKIAE